MTARRARWYVVNPRRRNGSAVLSVRWQWLARFACAFDRTLDYGKPGTFGKSYRRSSTRRGLEGPPAPLVMED